MNKAAKVEIVKDPALEYSYSYKVTKRLSTPFYVPVIDVRDGKVQRDIANSILKASNSNKGSQFIKRSASEASLFSQLRRSILDRQTVTSSLKD